MFYKQLDQRISWLLKKIYNLYSRILNVRIILLHGGLGDIILLTPFLFKVKSENKNVRLVVRYRDDVSTANKKNFSFDSSRLMTSADGSKINYRREFLENIKIIDKL